MSSTDLLILKGYISEFSDGDKEKIMSMRNRLREVFDSEENRELALLGLSLTALELQEEL